MKRKLNTGINFSGIESKICLKKQRHFSGIILKDEAN